MARAAMQKCGRRGLMQQQQQIPDSRSLVNAPFKLTASCSSSAAASAAKQGGWHHKSFSCGRHAQARHLCYLM